MSNSQTDTTFTSDIAIIGMACDFPGAKDTDDFWINLRNGVESISFFTDEEVIASGVSSDILKKEDFVKAGGILNGIDMFDASFFNYSQLKQC